MKFLCLLCFFLINTKPTKAVTAQKSTFGPISLNTQTLFAKENLSFSQFLSEFKEQTLKSFSQNFLGYHTKDVIFIFNIKENKSFSVKLTNLNRTEKIECFSFDGKKFVVKLRRRIIVLDLNGNEISSYNLANKEIFGMDIFINNNFFYLISHSKEIFAFKIGVGKELSEINLIFYNNDFFSSSLSKFNFILKDHIYVLHKDRFSIVDKRSGKILKNTQLNTCFDNFLLLNNSAFFYSKGRFALIDFVKYNTAYSNQVELAKKSLTLNSDGHISFDGQIYKNNYIYTHFFKNLFFRYAENTYESLCLLIKEGKVAEFLIKNFAISHVFYLNNSLVLIDIKAKKLVVV